MPPCDVQPDELDIAVLVDRLEQATTLQVKRIASKWAGLRSFVADKTLVAGFDPQAEGFFWLAGQGGYGIQTSPTMARVTAGLVAGKGLPSDVTDLGVLRGNPCSRTLPAVVAAQRSASASLAPRAANAPAKVRRIQVSTRGREITWSRIAAANSP